MAVEKQPIDGNQLLKDCKSVFTLNAAGIPFDSEGALICMSSVRAIRDAIAMFSPKHPTIKICIPNNVSYFQSVKIVIKFLENNPSMLHHIDNHLIVIALKDAFPCKN